MIFNVNENPTITECCNQTKATVKIFYTKTVISFSLKILAKL